MNKIKSFLDASPLSNDIGLLVLRLVAGGAMLTHGFPKLEKLMAGDLQFGDPIGLGPEVSLVLTVFAEFFCSLLLILGLTTRFALVPLIITMFVASFIVHAGDDFGTIEKGVLFLVIYLSLFFTGPGKLSVDNTLFQKQSHTPAEKVLS